MPLKYLPFMITGYVILFLFFITSCNCNERHEEERDSIDTNWVIMIYKSKQLILKTFQDVAIFKRGKYYINYYPPSFTDTILVIYPSNENNFTDSLISKGIENVNNQDSLFKQVKRLIHLKDSFKIREAVWTKDWDGNKYLDLYSEDMKAVVVYHQSCNITGFSKKHYKIIFYPDSCWYYKSAHW